MRRILLLDDEQNVLQALQRSLRQIFKNTDLKIEAFTAPEMAVQRLNEMTFDFVISDYHMPGMNGVEVLRMTKQLQPHAIRMMLSASADFNTIIGAINEAEIFRYIAKPWNSEDLKDAILAAGKHRDQELEDSQLADELRVQRGAMTPQEQEAKRLEESEPGITKVRWGPDGSVLLD
jgi:two-component system probable response regulator PhcQ